MVYLTLIWKSLTRERALFGLWILSLCIAVTGLLVVDVFRHSLSYTLQVEGRKILTGDVSVSARRPLTDSEKKILRESLPATAEFSEKTELFGMLSTDRNGIHESRLAGLHFIDDHYPLAGDFQIERSGGPLLASHGSDLGAQAEIWVAPDLLTLMNLNIGDVVKIGELQFKLAGVVRKDSSQTFRFGNMAPRVYLHRRYLDPSGLIQFGSTFSQTTYAIVDEPATLKKKEIEQHFTDPGIQITVPTDLEQGAFRVLIRLLDFLGLTGLVTLSLGWIGVYYLGRRWLSLEAVSGGILKCMGFSPRELRQYLVLKLSLIMCAGILLGGALAWIAAHAVFPLVRESLPAGFILVWSWPSTILLLLVGPLSGLLLMFPAIRGVAQDQPLALVQGRGAFRTDLWDFLAFSGTTAVLFFIVTLAQARSWRVTFIFLGALLGTVLLVTLIGFGALRILESLRPKSGWRTHLAVSLWTRRRALAVLMITVSAMAGLLSQLVPNLEKTLVGELRSPEFSGRPSLFLFDIQNEQMLPLKDFLNKNNIQISQTAPFIRARILKVNGADFERTQVGEWATREEEMDARFRNRGINLSYREKLSAAEKILSGKPYAELSHDFNEAEISVESGYADRLKLKLGDVLRFDVQGLELNATIANLREVNWDSFEPNFFITFPLGVLDEAPKTWILTVAKSPELTSAKMQGLITRQFPNVTSINVQEALDNAGELFAKLSSGLKLASGLCLALGIFVFLMILLFQLASSQRDWLQLKILGLAPRDLLTLQVLTYGGLCLLGLILGSLMSVIVAYALARFAFEAHLQVDWLKMSEIFAASFAAAIVGMVAMSWGRDRRLANSH